MRPESFVPFVMDCIKNTPGVARVQTLAEAGEAKYPFGFVVTVGSNEVGWQVSWQSAGGERDNSPAADIDGEPAAWTDSTVQDGGEEWLAAVIGRAESPQIARIERWSPREGNRPGHVGITLYFHNGRRTFLRRI